MNKKAFSIAISIFIIFVFINIISSQTISNIFPEISLKQSKNNIILFLINIKSEKYFQNQLSYYQEIYKKDLKSEVFANENHIKAEINKYEEILKQNSKSKDALIMLSLLNLKLNNKKESNYFYNAAKKIDPETKIKELELFY